MTRGCPSACNELWDLDQVTQPFCTVEWPYLLPEAIRPDQTPLHEYHQPVLVLQGPAKAASQAVKGENITTVSVAAKLQNMERILEGQILFHLASS